MKRLSFILIALFISICAFAQSEHIKFMGIPMGISISSFQSKLEAKGVKYDKASKQLPSGSRMFQGTFAGHKAQIFVYYDPSTKLVYRTKACVEREDKPALDQVFFDFISMFAEKFGEENVATPMQSQDQDKRQSHLKGYSSRNIDLHYSGVFTENGRIDIYEVVSDPDYIIHINDVYTLHIDYFDDAAESINHQSILEDL